MDELIKKIYEMASEIGNIETISSVDVELMDALDWIARTAVMQKEHMWLRFTSRGNNMDAAKLESAAIDIAHEKIPVHMWSDKAREQRFLDV
jgi:hypothetical protein